jgi:hypothetical protein
MLLPSHVPFVVRSFVSLVDFSNLDSVGGGWNQRADDLDTVLYYCCNQGLAVAEIPVRLYGIIFVKNSLAANSVGIAGQSR